MIEEQQQSVKEALEKGRKLLVQRKTLITRILIAVMITLCFFRLISIPVMLFSGVVLIFLFQWIYQSYLLTKWKMQAFESVRNVHELKAKAIMEGLMPETPGILEKRLQTRQEKQRLKELEKKFRVPDELDNYFTVEKETRIYYPKSNYWKALVFFGLGVVVTPLFYWLKREWYILLLLLPEIYFFWYYSRKLHKNTPYIILNDKGIETIKCSFVPWSLIEDERVLREKEEEIMFYLFFRHPGGSERVNIDNLAIKPGDLYDLLKIYRKRFTDNSLK